MRFVKTLLVSVIVMLPIAGAATAADWTTTEEAVNANNVCGGVNKGGVCWLFDIVEDSSTISVRECTAFTIMVYGTGASIMPQACDDRSCTKPENMLSAVLTGDSPTTFLASTAPFEYVRIDWTAGGAAPTVSIKCSK